MSIGTDIWDVETFRNKLEKSLFGLENQTMWIYRSIWRYGLSAILEYSRVIQVHLEAH